ncbi:MAG: hypothetical protein HY928_15390 [Elusimicrobia bacterium]|nr:hypothetical protein [Elusimicrobiota bacterium]
MRIKSFLSLLVSFSMLVPTGAGAVEGLSGTLTPKLSLFDYTGGGKAERAHFLQRYDYAKSWFGQNISGAYMDLDLSLAYSGLTGHSFLLERRGEGLSDQSGLFRYDSDYVGVSGMYGHHRSVAVGVDYLLRPNNVPGGTDASYTGTGSGYVATFNDDSDGAFFRVDRTNYGAEVKVKPALLGDMASLSVKHDGYRRTGNSYATWTAGGSDFTIGAPQSHRWRGYNRPIEETMNRGSIGFAASPMGWFQFAYDGSVEKFVSRAQNFTMAYAASRPSVLAAGATMTAGNRIKPVHFVPDSTLTTHALRLSRTFKNSAWAAGYGMSVLGQDSFTPVQITGAYGEGKIASKNLFLSGKARVLPALETEGYIKYGNRRNDSTFPAGTFLTATTDQKLDLRLNDLKTVEYGLSAALRPAGSRSSLGAGWKRENKKRGFTYNNSAGGTGILPKRMLYTEESVSDEVSVKGVLRPTEGLDIRLTPSYQWSDKLGSPLDSKESVNLKADASYMTDGGTVFAAYYALKDKRNDSLSFTNANTPTGADGSQTPQTTRNVLNSAGASMSVACTPKVNSSLSADWMQNDFQYAYITSNRRRYAATPAGGIVFRRRDGSRSIIDTTTLGLATDWQAADSLKVSGSYSLSRSKGNVATGLLATELGSTNDGAVDNDTHSLSFGAEYGMTSALTLSGQYSFDHYQDNRNAFLSGSGHAVTTALAYKF